MDELEIWTVYENPRDAPGYFVARLFLLDKPTGRAIYARTLENLRAQLPAGLCRMPRDDSDEPHIVETWF